MFPVIFEKIHEGSPYVSQIGGKPHNPSIKVAQYGQKAVVGQAVVTKKIAIKLKSSLIKLLAVVVSVVEFLVRGRNPQVKKKLQEGLLAIFLVLRRENNRWLGWNTDYNYHSKHTYFMAAGAFERATNYG